METNDKLITTEGMVLQELIHQNRQGKPLNLIEACITRIKWILEERTEIVDKFGEDVFYSRLNGLLYTLQRVIP